MSKKRNSNEWLQNIFAPVAIILAFVVSVLLFENLMGNPVNFQGGNPAGEPISGNYLGIIYKGGFIVPVLMTCV
ncbi:MAG TPA: MotA/TolQ/ExbB proton channel family protein, partial [Bacteroidetes bacterium]|nr:MotA/TolQ/ExbB proton channel family protein [Bacteroidota bacterium]